MKDLSLEERVGILEGVVDILIQEVEDLQRRLTRAEGLFQPVGDVQQRVFVLERLLHFRQKRLQNGDLRVAVGSQGLGWQSARSFRRETVQ